MDSLYEDKQLNLASKVDDHGFNHEKFKDAARWVYECGLFSPEMLADTDIVALIDETYRVLVDGINSSITQDVPESLTKQLKENTYRFSGFKTYHEMKFVSELLRDKKTGTFKPYDTFEQEVLAIDNQYNRNYLWAEYNLAVQSTQMAVKWHEFAKDGDDYYLQYRTAGDDKVRPEHQVLNNTTLPFSDKFWDKFYPPLGWNCRCTVVQVRKQSNKPSDSDEACAAGDIATSSPQDKIFRYNPGKTKTTYPPKHPYMPKGCKGCDWKNKSNYDKNSARCRACSTITDNLSNDE